MSHVVLALLPMVAAAVSAGGCYQDAVAPAGAAVTVLLVDGWTPPGTIDRVEVYVAEIEASTTADTLPEQQSWTRIAPPNRRHDLSVLTLGAAVVVAGSGFLPAGTYQSVRLTLNTDSTRVTLADGRLAKIRWPVTGEYRVPAILEGPLSATEGGDLRLVLEIDLDRSFAGNVDPVFDLVFVPAVRALDPSVAGSLAGTVRADTNPFGTAHPLANAAITVRAPAAGLSADVGGRIIAVGRTNAQGAFRIGYLVAGSYTVQVEAPAAASLPPLTVPEILIATGGESRLDVTLTGSRGPVAEPVVPPFGSLTARQP